MSALALALACGSAGARSSLRPAVPRRITMGGLLERLQCSRATGERMIRDGRMPMPIYCGMRRLFDLDLVEEAERRLHESHASTLTGAAGTAAGHRAAAQARDAKTLCNLHASAASFLQKRSAVDLARVIGKFAPDGRIASIPRERRPAAMRALGVSR